MGEAVPQYVVALQRADGYSVTATTDAAGAYAATVPVPPANACYQVVGRSDAYYAQTGGAQKFCTTSTVNLTPMIRINGIAGSQKVYIPDSSQQMAIPIRVSALSRSFPAPFDGQPLPWHAGFTKPDGTEPYSHHAGGTHGVFGAPEVRRLAENVWQYVWSSEMTLPANHAGFYDMEWGRDGSVFEPMMECQMVWFGFGIDSPPQKAIPGGTVTINGRRFGAEPGSIVLKGSGAVTTISGTGIVSWSDTQIVFSVPPLAKTGWVSVVRPSGVPTNAQYLEIGPVRIPV